MRFSQHTLFDPVEWDGLRIEGNQLWVDGLDWPVAIKRLPQRNRLTLSADRFGHFDLKCSNHSTVSDLLNFVSQHRDWLIRKVARVQPGKPFEDGAVLPILGVPLTIRHEPQHNRPPERDDDHLRVGGKAEFIPRRVETYLRDLALKTISAKARRLAARVNRVPKAIRVKDTKTRWGSCSGRGNLNFSWRIILAPEPTLDYLVAHEVAHLVHMNHRAEFWAVCASLLEGGKAAVDAQEAWLQSNGASLHAYGRGRSQDRAETPTTRAAE